MRKRHRDYALRFIDRTTFGFSWLSVAQGAGGQEDYLLYLPPYGVQIGFSVTIVDGYEIWLDHKTLYYLRVSTRHSQVPIPVYVDHGF